MSIHLLFVPFHLFALFVLVGGEVRAYPSHRNIWRAVSIPPGFVLAPFRGHCTAQDSAARKSKSLPCPTSTAC